MYIVLVAQNDSKHMFSINRPDRRITLTLLERALFSAYSALYLNKFHLVWIEIFTNPTLCGAKNSNQLRVPSHLVTWIPQTEHAYKKKMREKYVSKNRIFRLVDYRKYFRSSVHIGKVTGERSSVATLLLLQASIKAEFKTAVDMIFLFEKIWLNISCD